MKKIIFLSFILFLISVHFSRLNGQPADYEIYFRNISSYSDEILYSKLLNYQKTDPYFASIYVQLGEVTYRLLQKADPLKEYKTVIDRAKTSIIYYQLNTFYAKEKEARSNRDFYANLPIEKKDNKLANEEIRAFVDLRISQLKNFSDSLTMVYSNLEKSKECYNVCISIYYNLNKKYTTLNDALLHCDKTMLDLLGNLKMYFDSTLLYFNNFKGLIKTFPLKGYDQQYNLKTIHTFRLDGLTNSNFLDNSFTIWDYKTWADEFISLYESDIAPLRQEIERLDKEFDALANYAVKRTILQAEAQKPVCDEKFFFRLGKYDNNSLVGDLFSYKIKKQKFLADWLDPLMSPNDTVKGLLQRKVRFYASFIEAKSNLDSILTSNRTLVTDDKTGRFESFFRQNYKGAEGLRLYYDQEKKEMAKILDQSFATLNAYIKLEKQPNAQKYISFQKDSIPMFVTKEMYTGRYKVSDVVKTERNITFLAGQEVVKDNIAPFIAKTNNQGKILWLKPLQKPYKANSGITFSTVKVFPDDNGCFVVYTLKIPAISNILARFDADGNELSHYNIPVELYPVFFKFDDLSQRFIVAFQGNDSLSADNLEKFVFCVIDSIGNILWKNEFEHTGFLNQVIKTENNYLVITSFKICILDGTTYKINTDGSIWGSMVISYDQTGKIINKFAFKKASSFHITDVLKLSASSICLIGRKSRPDQMEGDLFFSIINPGGKIIYSN